jgi:hypothetical protein
LKDSDLILGGVIGAAAVAMVMRNQDDVSQSGFSGIPEVRIPLHPYMHPMKNISQASTIKSVPT